MAIRIALLCRGRGGMIADGHVTSVSRGWKGEDCLILWGGGCFAGCWLLFSMAPPTPRDFRGTEVDVLTRFVVSGTCLLR